jgi:hypothetical protein
MPCFWQNAARGAFLFSRNLFTFGSLISLRRALRCGSCLRIDSIRSPAALEACAVRWEDGQKGPEGNCPASKPPFEIIHSTAEETKKAADGLPTACPVLLPLLDELRTYCYEHRIEEIPALLAG